VIVSKIETEAVLLLASVRELAGPFTMVPV
jgi:hypothetical protein